MPKFKDRHDDSVGMRSISLYKDQPIQEPSSSTSVATYMESKPYDRNSHRSVQARWFCDFSWLHEQSGALYCRTCEHASKVNVFTKGKRGHPKRDDLKKHELTGDHRMACQELDLKPQMANVQITAHKQMKESILAGTGDWLPRTVTVSHLPGSVVPNLHTAMMSGSALTTQDNSEALNAAVQSILPTLSYDKHKGQAGRIGIIGGCQEYTGAPYYAAITALKVGCDLAHVFCTGGAGPVIKSYSPELIVHPILDHPNAVDEVGKWLPRLHALVIGPGLGRDDILLDTVKSVLHKAKRMQIPMVIDADGVFLLTQDPQIIKGYMKATLTPNVMEFGRLYQAVMNRKLSSGQDGADYVVELSTALGNVTVVRKGREDIIACGDKVVVCDVEGSPRRCGGQGDLLSGSLGTLTYWAHSAVKSTDNDLLTSLGPTVVASYGACALTKECNRAAFAINRRSTTTTDMIPCIQQAFESFFGTD